VSSLVGSEKRSGTAELWFQVLLNNDGTEEGTLHQLLIWCITPSGVHCDTCIRRHSNSWCTQESACSVSGFTTRCVISGLPTIGTSIDKGFQGTVSCSLSLDAVEELTQDREYEFRFGKMTAGLPGLNSSSLASMLATARPGTSLGSPKYATPLPDRPWDITHPTHISIQANRRGRLRPG